MVNARMGIGTQVVAEALALGSILDLPHDILPQRGCHDRQETRRRLVAGCTAGKRSSANLQRSGLRNLHSQISPLKIVMSADRQCVRIWPSKSDLTLIRMAHFPCDFNNLL